MKNKPNDCIRVSILLFLILFLPVFCMGQIPFRVMSYNVENLFYPEDDPATDDKEFTPAGARHWGYARYHHKLRQIAKVIMAAGEWDTPALVALCEVENDSVLAPLTHRTPLRSQSYRYCITRGSDNRGINVALLYQRDKFRYINHHSLQVVHPHNVSPTRDVLHVWGEIAGGDTLDIIACHFPSKYGGEKESEARRMDAARTLRALTDSLSLVRKAPLLIALGDFNDLPRSECMQYLTATNLILSTTEGSHKYQGNWQQIDHILIHRRMSTPEPNMQLIPNSARTFAPSFLLVEDKTWLGQRPHRTYYGYKYEAGYSDHLPILADFLIR